MKDRSFLSVNGSNISLNYLKSIECEVYKELVGIEGKLCLYLIYRGANIDSEGNILFPDD